METRRAEKPAKPVVQASFSQTAMGLFFLRRKVTRHESRKRLSFSKMTDTCIQWSWAFCNLYSEETCKPVYPRLDDQQPDMPATQCNQQPDYDVLQVYIVTWLAEVNVDAHRVDEMYAEVGKEMHVKLS